jgi:hypothetical protein
MLKVKVFNMLNSAETLNNLGSANWICYIPGYKNLTLKVTKFDLPEVNAGVTAIGNRTEFVLQTSGDHITYENLELEFLVDENLLNYITLYQWMRENTRTGIEAPQSIFLHFLGNDKRFQGIEVEFYEAFPITLSKISMDTDGNSTDVSFSASFTYTAFDFVDKTEREFISNPK